MAHYTWVLIFYTHRYLFFCLLCSQIVPFKRVFPSNSTARCGQIRRNTVLVFTGCLFCSTLTIIVVASQTLITTGASTLFTTTTATTCILAGAKLVLYKSIIIFIKFMINLQTNPRQIICKYKLMVTECVYTNFSSTRYSN